MTATFGKQHMERPMYHTDVQRGERIALVLFHALLAAAAVLLLLFVFTADFERVLSAIPDDAAYFFEIAGNVASGAGETFDGLNRTNGYQPLWLYLLVPVYRIGTGSPESMCRIVLAIQTVLLAVVSVLLYSWCARFFSWRVVLLVGIICIVFVLSPSVNGMESAILITILSILVVLGWKVGITAPAPFEQDLLFGLVTGLVVLARLDMVFLPFVVCALCLGRGMRGGAERVRYIRKAVAIGIGTALIVAPYLIRNYLVYGGVIPISGALKSSFPRASVTGYAFSRMGLRDRAAILVAIGYLVWVVVTVWRGGFRDSERGDMRRMLASGAARSAIGYFELTVAVLSVTVLLHFLHTALFMKWAIFRWHFLIYSFVAVLALCEPVNRILSRTAVGRHRGFYWGCVVLLVAFGCFVTGRRYGGRAAKGWISASYKAARWAHEHTGEKTVFAMKDAGNFGYFSRRSVISLDGVVNNAAYQDAIRERRLNAYLADMDVTYLVQHAFWDREDITDGSYETFPATYTSRLYGAESDTVLLRREWEVYRSEPYYDGPYRTVFLIWKLGEIRDGG